MFEETIYFRIYPLFEDIIYYHSILYTKAMALYSKSGPWMAITIELSRQLIYQVL